MPRPLAPWMLLMTLAGILALLPAPATAPLSAATSSDASSSETFALSLLPSSSDLVIWADYSALRKSGLVEEMEARIDSVPEAAEHYRQFVRETGLDPRADTDQVLMALGGGEGSAGGGFLLVARGRFGGSRLLEAVAEKGGSLETTPRGPKIWISRGGPGAGEDPAAEKGITALAQSDPQTLLFGSEGEVRRALDVAIRAKSPATKEPRFRELLAGVDRKAPLWAVLNSRSLAREVSSEIGRNNSDWKPGEALASVDSVRLMAWVGKDVDLKVQVKGRDGESAGLLADLFRGMVAAGKLAAKDRDPELLKILGAMSITEAGTEVEIRASIPGSRLRLPPGAPGEH